MARYDFKQLEAEPDLKDILSKAKARIDEINTYLTIADSATATQIRDEVKNIDQAQRAIIKALVRIVQRTA